MSVTSEIIDDTRPIESVWFEEGDGFKVGTLGITKINSYGEPGEYEMQPWIKVYRGDSIHARFPARRVAIIYQEEKNAKDV